MRKILFVSSIIALISIVFTKTVELLPDQEYSSKLLNNEILYFITSSVSNKNDIKVSADLIKNPNEKISGEPILYVSTTSELNNIKEADFICNQLASEECIIPSSLIKDNSNLYIALQGCNECEYNLKYTVKKDKNVNLNLGQKLYIQIKGGISQSFSISSELYEKLNLSIFNLKLGEFNFIVKESSSFDYVINKSWRAGYEVFFSSNRENKEASDKKEIEFYLTAKEDSFYIIESYNSKTPVQIEHTLYSIEEVHSKSNKCFDFKFNNSNNTKIDLKLLHIIGNNKAFLKVDANRYAITDNISYLLNKENNICLENNSENSIVIQLEAYDSERPYELTLYKQVLNSK